MIAKIVTGKSFGGTVRYLTQKSGHARILDSDGIDTRSIKDMIGSFNFQRKARPEKAEVVGHISLSFHKDDAPRLTDGFMTDLAHEYMQRMGITDTQYMVVRHTDTEHPHLHILYNRVRYDAKLVRSHNERIRSVAVCKVMKQKHGLTFSEGKQNVKTEKLHQPDKVKYAVYEAVKAILPNCLSLPELAERLQDQGITTTFIHRGGDPKKEIQGVTFTKDNMTFKASQVDRKFSYANLCKTIERNTVERQRQAATLTESDHELVKYLCGVDYDPSKLNKENAAKIVETERTEAEQQQREQAQRESQRRREQAVQTPAEQRPGQGHMHEAEVWIGEQYKQAAPTPTPEPITEIRGMKLTPEQQRRLYSPQGLKCSYGKNGYRNTSLFRINRTPGRDILTEELLSQEKINRNPRIFGIRLTDRQVQDIKDGEYIYLENMKEDDGTLFSGYVVMPDDMKQGWIYQFPPDRIVKEDKFYIREMDKLLADHGYVVRAKVRFWGPTQPESRQYFWKERTGFYDCSYDDPRTPKSKLSREEKLHVSSVTQKKKLQGPKM